MTQDTSVILLHLTPGVFIYTIIISIFLNMFYFFGLYLFFLFSSLLHGRITNVNFHQRNEGKQTFMTTAELYFSYIYLNFFFLSLW